MRERFISHTPAQTARVAKALAASVQGGQVIALYGELGTGKTTFAQAFAKALGVKKRVQSPTFILMQEYPIARRGTIRKFLHVDAYRGDEAQFKAVGLPEYFEKSDTVVLIEWADRIQRLLPKKRMITVHLTHKGADERSIAVIGGSFPERVLA